MKFIILNLCIFSRQSAEQRCSFAIVASSLFIVPCRLRDICLYSVIYMSLYYDLIMWYASTLCLVVFKCAGGSTTFSSPVIVGIGNAYLI